MSFDPNQPLPPEPSTTPGDEGADLGTPQPGPGETTAGADQASIGEMTPEELAADNRRLQQRVGTLSEELRARYEAPPTQYGPPPGAAPPPGPAPGLPPFEVKIPDEALATFDDYGIPREQVQGFAQGVGGSVYEQVVRQVVPMVQDMVITTAHADSVTRQFFGTNKDLEPYRPDVRNVALQFMQNPGQARGRSLEMCLPEIGNIVRLHRNLPGAVVPGGVATATPKEAASMEGAQTAPGGSAGGAAGSGQPRTPAPKVPPKNPAADYIDMRTDDHASRLLGGTRIGQRALQGTKVK